MNNKRRSFRSRSQKSNFRRRNGTSGSNNLSSINYNRNKNFNRNGSSNNIHNVEKTMQKFQQLAKDAQSSGDENPYRKLPSTCRSLFKKI